MRTTCPATARSSRHRRDADHVAGHLPGAIPIPQADLATRPGEIPKDRDVLLVCAGGARSARCTAFLRQMGFGKAISLTGGTDCWRDAGPSIEREDTSTRA
jgi:rhodanese-related sulfurtransferase